MFIHAVANAVVCFFSFGDLLTALDEPQHSCVGRQSSDVPTQMIVALHIYHLAFFHCRADDIVHHLVFVSSLGGVGLYVDGGALLNLVAFFMCGLPGGLDYAMLVAVKHELLSPLSEKAWNSRINVWIRSPGLMLAAFLLYQATRHGPPGSTCAQRIRGPPPLFARLAAAGSAHGAAGQGTVSARVRACPAARSSIIKGVTTG